VKSIT